MSYEQFFMLDVIGASVDLLTTIPCLFLIAKIGNNASLRVATGLMVISACLFTFGDHLAFFIIANILYFKTYQFFVVYPLILENNLDKYGRKDDFIKLNARGRLFFSIMSLSVALVAGYLFDLNTYLPMYFCIGLTVIAFLCSFFVRDETGGKYDVHGIMAKSEHKMDKSFIWFSIMLVIFMIIFKGCWYVGGQYSKISLQEIGMLVEAIAIVLFLARAMRVLVNVFSEKVIKRFGAKLAVILPTLLMTALALLSLPLIFIQDFIAKLILVSAGVILLFCLHDVYKLFIFDIIHRLYPKDLHLKMFWFSALFDTVGILFATIIITCAVAILSVGYALLILVGACFLCVGIGLYVYFAMKKRLGQQNQELDPNELL